MLACKDALEEANGDEEKAIEILRKKGIAQAAKKAARDQAEGLVFLKSDKSKAAMLLLRCETDFVARDDVFSVIGKELVETLFAKGEDAAKKLAEQKLPDVVQKLGENISVGEMATVAADIAGTYVHSNAKIGVVIGLKGGTEEHAKDLAMHAAAMAPKYVTPDQAPADLIASERGIWEEQVKKEGKPAAIAEKILLGKEKKFREENALLKQAFVKDPSKTIEQYLGGAEVTQYVRMSVK
jgi:elongation factor Ts